MSAHDKRCVHVLGFPPEEFRLDRASDGCSGADKGWYDMSEEEQQCAQMLGWDDVKWWRRDRVPQTKSWTELSLHEQNAAVFLVCTQPTTHNTNIITITLVSVLPGTATHET